MDKRAYIEVSSGNIGFEKTLLSNMCPLYDTFITSGDGKTVAIGNPWNANNGEQSGLARVYRIDGRLNWKEMGQGFFGEKLKDGNALAISATLSNGGAGH